MTLAVSPEEKMIARFYEEVWKARPKFFIHRRDADDSSFVAIGQVAEVPGEGLVSLGTNGLSNHPLYRENGDEYADTRLELLGACLDSQVDDFEQMLFFSSRIVIEQRWLCAPGTFLLDAVSRFGTFPAMQHLYFTTPFAFEGFQTQTFGQRTVSWLQAVPVSTSEMELARRNSTDALETVMEEQDIDWFDLNRQPMF